MAVSLYTPNGILHETSVDFRQRTIPKPIHVVQYDDTLPILSVELNIAGQPYVLPSDAKVNLRFGKPDKTFVITPALGCNSTRAVVYFEIGVQMTVFSGEYNPIIEVTTSGRVASSSPIKLVIDRNPVQRDYIESTTDFRTLEEYNAESLAALTKIRQLESSATQSATNATNASKSASDSAAKAKQSADSATNAASQSQHSANDASDSAAKAKKSEDNSKASEVNAKSSETNAATSESNSKISETNAEQYMTAAKTSETNAVRSETNAKSSEVNAEQSSSTAKLYADSATKSATSASTSEKNAKDSETAANDLVTQIRKDLSDHVFDGHDGPKGEKGDKGDPGESGVLVKTSGMFALSVEPNGDLYVHYLDESTPPEFELNDDGNLYIEI